MLIIPIWLRHKYIMVKDVKLKLYYHLNKFMFQWASFKVIFFLMLSNLNYSTK